MAASVTGTGSVGTPCGVGTGVGLEKSATILTVGKEKPDLKLALFGLW